MGISPNPAKDVIEIQYQNLNANKLDYFISNTLGQEIMKGSVMLNAQNKSLLNIDQLPQGTYFVKFTGPDFQSVLKLIKE